MKGRDLLLIFWQNYHSFSQLKREASLTFSKKKKVCWRYCLFGNIKCHTLSRLLFWAHGLGWIFFSTFLINTHQVMSLLFLKFFTLLSLSRQSLNSTYSFIFINIYFIFFIFYSYLYLLFLLYKNIYIRVYILILIMFYI